MSRVDPLGAPAGSCQFRCRWRFLPTAAAAGGGSCGSATATAVLPPGVRPHRGSRTPTSGFSGGPIGGKNPVHELRSRAMIRSRFSYTARSSLTAPRRSTARSGWGLLQDRGPHLHFRNEEFGIRNAEGLRAPGCNVAHTRECDTEQQTIGRDARKGVAPMDVSGGGAVLTKRGAVEGSSASRSSGDTSQARRRRPSSVRANEVWLGAAMLAAAPFFWRRAIRSLREAR
jgi:hypothetical protein